MMIVLVYCQPEWWLCASVQSQQGRTKYHGRFGRIWPHLADKGQFTHSKQGKPFCKMPTGIARTSGVRWRDPVTIFYQEKSKVTGLVIF
jgi:hypothetical protein